VTKPDDSTLPDDQLPVIRRHATMALQQAGAIGIFPTPVSDVMDAAKVVVAPAQAIDEGFLSWMRRKAKSALKSALSKVRGVLDAAARLVYLDKALYPTKQTFIKLHETAHAVLPWQRDLYAVIEDCDETLAPEMSEEFDRQANVFAAEVLFQIDAFATEAADCPFGIRTPLDLSKKYGASAYATIRRYVGTNCRACAVLVIDQPQLTQGEGFVATLRRVVASPSFAAQFGPLSWPEEFTPADEVGAMIPIGRRMSRPRNLTLVDRNGVRHECVAEAFNTSYQVFVLIHAVATLTKKVVVIQ
jgi:hypothetical protein